MQQGSLFQLDPLAPGGLPDGLPEGLLYQSDFLSDKEESSLLRLFERLPLAEARYKSFVARRRVLSFGGTFEYETNQLGPASPLIEELWPLREKVAQWAGLVPENLAHALIAHYPPGAPLGWHRDVPDFEEVFGVSLGTCAVLRFRPYPPARPQARDIKRLVAEPRSIYAMRGPARWSWQHSVAPVEASRYAITFRTFRARAQG
jgi:alkylated DNA repair dioxygenase AlkB